LAYSFDDGHYYYVKSCKPKELIINLGKDEPECVNNFENDILDILTFKNETETEKANSW